MITEQLTMRLDADRALSPKRLGGEVRLRHRPTGVVGTYWGHVEVGHNKYNITVLVENGGTWDWPLDTIFGRPEGGVGEAMNERVP